MFMDGVVSEIRERLRADDMSLRDARYKRKWRVDCLMFVDVNEWVTDSVKGLQLHMQKEKAKGEC